jgi:hypothetical protein
MKETIDLKHFVEELRKLIEKTEPVNQSDRVERK